MPSTRSSRAHFLSLHFDRAFGCYRDNRHSRGNSISGFRQSARKRAAFELFEQSQAIGLAFEQYKNDNDGYYVGATSSGGAVSWADLIDPYLKNHQVFQCPSTAEGAPQPQTYLDDQTKTYYSVSTIGAGATGVKSNSYGRNCIVNRSNPSGNATNDGWTTAGWGNGYSSDPTTNATKIGFVLKSGSTSINEASVEDASGTIHIFDVIGQKPNENSLNKITSEEQTDRSNKATQNKVSQRHFDGFNALYGDGHVKFRKWGSTRAQEWTVQDD